MSTFAQSYDEGRAEAVEKFWSTGELLQPRDRQRRSQVRIQARGRMRWHAKKGEAATQPFPFFFRFFSLLPSLLDLAAVPLS